MASKLKIRPLHDRLIVKRVEENQKTKGGIIIPDSSKEKSLEGEVVAVGNGKTLDNGNVLPLAVKVGDRVMFGQYAGQDIKVEGTDYLIIQEKDVQAIWDK